MIERIITGSQDTSYHDFTVLVEGESLTINEGTYYQLGESKFQSHTPSTLSLPDENEGVFLTESGFEIMNLYTETPYFLRLVWKEEGNLYFMKIVEG